MFFSFWRAKITFKEDAFFQKTVASRGKSWRGNHRLDLLLPGWCAGASGLLLHQRRGCLAFQKQKRRKKDSSTTSRLTFPLQNLPSDFHPSPLCHFSPEHSKHRECIASLIVFSIDRKVGLTFLELEHLSDCAGRQQAFCERAVRRSLHGPGLILRSTAVTVYYISTPPPSCFFSFFPPFLKLLYKYICILFIFPDCLCGVTFMLCCWCSCIHNNLQISNNKKRI